MKRLMGAAPGGFALASAKSPTSPAAGLRRLPHRLELHAIRGPEESDDLVDGSKRRWDRLNSSTGATAAHVVIGRPYWDKGLGDLACSSRAPRYLTASARVNPIIRGKAPVETGSLFTVSGDTGALAVASGNRVFISRRNPSSVSTLAAILAIRANSALLAATGLLAVSKAARSASPLINGAYFSRKRARPMASSASEYPTTARISSPFSSGFSGLKSRQRSA